MSGPPTSFRASTDGQGQYQLSALPAGTFTLCVHAFSPGVYDPCDWNSAAGSTRIAAGQQISLPIKLPQGYSVQVQAYDPLGLLVKTQNQAVQGHLIVGLWGNDGLFRTMPIKLKSSNGELFESFIHARISVSLSVFSRDLTLTDSTGKPVESSTGLVVPAQIAAGTSGPTVFVINVAGTK